MNGSCSKSLQASGTADPCAGSMAAPPHKQANIVNRATAFVLADSHQDYVVHSRLRNILRALIVIGVFGCVIAFTVVKYVTDDSLRGSTVTVREDDYSKLSQARVEVALCPCRNDTFSYSTFAGYRAPLSANYTEQVQVCQQAIVPELRTASPPTPDTPINETQAYIGYLDTLQANVATQIACSLSVQELLQALDPNPDAHIIGIGDSFFGADLLSQRQARQRVDAFIGDKVLQFSTDFATQLTLQRLILQQFQSNFTNAAAAVAQLNDTSATSAVEAAQISFDLYANITGDVLSTLTDTASNQTYVNGLLDTLKAAVTMDYNKYAAACNPYYCDFTKTKSAWSRLTEFLGLLGGLYTTFLGIGFTAWFLVDVILPQGHGKIMI